MTVALELTSLLSETTHGERDELRGLGLRALLQLAGHDHDDDELDSIRLAAALARDGLRALYGPRRTVLETPEVDSRIVIPTADLVRLVHGELDGYAAASLALKVRRSSAALAELGVLRSLREPEHQHPTRHQRA